MALSGRRRSSLIATCGAFVAFALACGARVTVATASRRDITETAVVSGRVDAAGRIQIGTVAPGIVMEVAVDEGQSVATGDLLLRLDDRTQSAALARARAALAEARARLVELRDVSHAVAQQDQEQACVEAAQAERAHARATRLLAAGAISAVEAEDAEDALAQARSRCDAATVRVSGTAAGGAETMLALAQLQAAAAGVHEAEAQLALRRIFAPADAIVLTRDVEPGDAVQPGRALLVLAREGTAKIIVDPDEKTLAVLRLGQLAIVSADAFPEARFEARVTKISPAIDTSRGTVDVELIVDDPPAFLRTDMTVSVEIIVGTTPAALVVPLDAVRDLATDRPWLLVVRGGATEERPVKLGARGERFIEIVQGLAEGEQVVVGSPALEPGGRVKPERP